MALLSMAIRELGGNAISFTGSQSGIMTNDRHVDARIVEVRPVRVQDELDRGRIVVIAGYQGVSYQRESRRSVAAEATRRRSRWLRLLEPSTAKSAPTSTACTPPTLAWCPTRDGSAHCWYEETQELAESGARVLNAQAVEFAKDKGIAIYARATASALPGADPSADGTVVRRDAPRMPGTVVGVSSEGNIVLLELDREGNPAEAGWVAALLDHLDALGVAGKQLHEVDHRVTLVISRENLHEDARVRDSLASRFGRRLQLTDELGTVSVIGAGINASFQNLRKGAAALAAAGIDPRGTTTSSRRITWMVARTELDQAVRSLHATFL